MKKVKVTIRFPKEIHKQLKISAKAQNTTMSELVCQALTKKLRPSSPPHW